MKGTFTLNEITIPVLVSPTIEGSGKTSYSEFVHVTYSMDDYNGLFITERAEALNFRHRMSKPGYFSSWHVAGDPTLIIIRSGALRVSLRNGQYEDFKAGDMFIAQDHLQMDELFNEDVHGHTAELLGNDVLLAVHIKLANKAN